MGGGALIRSEWLSMDLLAASGEPSADRAFADSSKGPLHSFFRTAASRPAGRTQGASLKAATGQGSRTFSVTGKSQRCVMNAMEQSFQQAASHPLPGPLSTLCCGLPPRLPPGADHRMRWQQRVSRAADARPCRSARWRPGPPRSPASRGGYRAMAGAARRG